MMPAMHKSAWLLASLVFVLGMAGAAAQQPEIVGYGHGPGLGVEQSLGGLTGAAFSYDAGRFRIDVLGRLVHFGENGPDASVFGIGGRFFFKLHEMPGADLSLGGGIGIILSDINDNSDTEIQV